MAEAKKAARRSAARPSARRVEPRLKLRSGTEVPLDGDLVYLIDALYRDLAVGTGFSTDYSDVQKDIARAIEQMDDATLREYFAASLFLNYTTYENEMADRLTAAIAAKARRSRGR